MNSIFGRTVDEQPDSNLAPPDTPAPPIEHARGERFRFRLSTTPRIVSGTSGLVLGTLLGFGGLIAVIGVLWAMFASFVAFNIFVLAIGFFGGMAALSGFGMILTAARRLMSSRISSAILEMDHDELHPGDRVRMMVIQRAPAHFESFTVSLVCTHATRRMVVVRSQYRDAQDREHPAVTAPRWNSSVCNSVAILREESMLVRRGHDYEKEVRFQVPDDAKLSASSVDQVFSWHFEVAGEPRLWPGYTDEYAVVVRPGRSSTPGSNAPL